MPIPPAKRWEDCPKGFIPSFYNQHMQIHVLVWEASVVELEPLHDSGEQECSVFAAGWLNPLAPLF